jgi:hypothetical protein
MEVCRCMKRSSSPGQQQQMPGPPSSPTQQPGHVWRQQVPQHALMQSNKPKHSRISFGMHCSQPHQLWYSSPEKPMRLLSVPHFRSVMTCSRSVYSGGSSGGNRGGGGSGVVVGVVRTKYYHLGGWSATHTSAYRLHHASFGGGKWIRSEQERIGTRSST